MRFSSFANACTVICHNKLRKKNSPNIHMTLILFAIYSFATCFINPRCGRPVADSNPKPGTPPIVIFAVLRCEATLWCSHKVNVKLHSAAALQQRAFKLIWLAVKPHAGARARTRTHARARTDAHRDTQRHRRART